MKILKLLMRVAMCSLLATASAVFAQTGQVVDLQGTATAQVVPQAAAGQPAPAPGVVRSLRLGDTINQGETISTGPRSRLALRFEDGQLISLTANSSFRIDAYTYNRAEPARSNVLFNLINGGMRAVTGLIGQARPQSVSYRAGNATIGIRGTDVTFAVTGGNLIINVNTGLISFVSATGAAPIQVSVGNAVFSNVNGMVTVGTPAAVAAAILTAIANNPMQAAALGQLAAAVVAVSPPGSALATSVTNAVASSPAAQAAFNAANPTPPAQQTQTGTTNTGPTTTTATGTVNTGTGTSGGGAGGSTLPLCSSIVSPVVANPNVNCRSS